MITEDQRAVVAFLSTPDTHGGVPVERVETHASIVFLAGSRALKLKRAVRYEYLDFSTVDRRRAMCEAELLINRRTAPTIYRGVVPVVRRADGTLTLGGPGTPVDWLVDMARFDQEGLFDRLASRDALDLALMPPLGAAIADFHAKADRRPDHGGAAGMSWVVEGNAKGFAEEGEGILNRLQGEKLTEASRRALVRHRAHLDARRDAGYVRHCHGDLHLRNIVLLDGRPTLFDAIEFNDDIACIDVFYDLAFLLMDLWRRRLPRHANSVFNSYLAETVDLEGASLLPLFLACRSAVRAKTSATAARLQSDPSRRGELETAARGYLSLAAALLQPARACLVAIGGFSGSGKSTLARMLAPTIGAVPGAIVLRSDDIRKRLCGVGPLTKLDAAGYGPEITRRVYETLAERAHLALRTGHSVIADAVYARPADRHAIELIARSCGLPFVGLWLEAPEPILVERSTRRQADASDADAAVVHAQLFRGAGEIAWDRVRASSGPEQVLDQASRIVEARAGTLFTSP